MSTGTNIGSFYYDLRLNTNLFTSVLNKARMDIKSFDGSLIKMASNSLINNQERLLGIKGIKDEIETTKQLIKEKQMELSTQRQLSAEIRALRTKEKEAIKALSDANKIYNSQVINETKKSKALELSIHKQTLNEISALKDKEKSQIESLTEANKKYSTNILDITNKIKNLQKQTTNDFNLAKEKEITQIKSLTESNKKYSNELTKIEAARKVALKSGTLNNQPQIIEYNQQIKDLTSNINKNNQQIKLHETALSKIPSKYEKINSVKLTGYNNSIQTLTNNINNNNSKIKTHQTTLNGLDNKYGSINKRLTNLNSGTLLQYGTNIKEITGNILKNNEKIKVHETTLGSLNSKYDAVGGTITKLSGEQLGLNKSLFASESALAGATGKLASFASATMSVVGYVTMADSIIKGFGSAIKGLGNGITQFITMPFAAVGLSMFKFASEAIESENLFNVVMGKHANNARKWSEDVSASLGMNEYYLRRNLAVWFEYVKNLGIVEATNEDFALKMSKDLTKLAYDISSLRNIPFSEAQNKLMSGMAGQVKAVREWGIDLTVANIEQEAVTMGMAKAGEQLDQTTKKLVAYKILMRDTATAHGDMARTAATPENQLRIFWDDLKERLAEIGMRLMPQMQHILNLVIHSVREFFIILDDMSKGEETFLTPFVNVFSKVMDILNRILDYYNSLSDDEKDMVENALAWLIVLGPILVLIGSIVEQFGILIPVIMTVYDWFVDIKNTIQSIKDLWDSVVNFDSNKLGASIKNITGSAAGVGVSSSKLINNTGIIANGLPGGAALMGATKIIGSGFGYGAKYIGANNKPQTIKVELEHKIEPNKDFTYSVNQIKKLVLGTITN